MFGSIQAVKMHGGNRGHVAHSGACSSCWPAIRAAVRHQMLSRDVRAAVAGVLLDRGERWPWRRVEVRRCESCGWTGGEHEMRAGRSIMGPPYPAGCPSCPAENKPFGKTIIRPVRGAHAVVPAEEATWGE